MPDLPISADEPEGPDGQTSEPLSQPDFTPRPQLAIQATSPAWPSIAVVLGIYWMLNWILDRIAPDPDDSLALRWSRALVDHPLRSPLALYLTLLALVGRRRSSGER